MAIGGRVSYYCHNANSSGSRISQVGMKPCPWQKVIALVVIPLFVQLNTVLNQKFIKEV